MPSARPPQRHARSRVEVVNRKSGLRRGEPPVASTTVAPATRIIIARTTGRQAGVLGLQLPSMPSVDSARFPLGRLIPSTEEDMLAHSIRSSEPPSIRNGNPLSACPGRVVTLVSVPELWHFGYQSSSPLLVGTSRVNLAASGNKSCDHQIPQSAESEDTIVQTPSHAIPRVLSSSFFVTCTASWLRLPRDLFVGPARIVHYFGKGLSEFSTILDAATISSCAQPRAQTQKHHRLCCRKVIERVEQNLEVPREVVFKLLQQIFHSIKLRRIISDRVMPRGL